MMYDLCKFNKTHSKYISAKTNATLVLFKFAKKTEIIQKILHYYKRVWVPQKLRSGVMEYFHTGPTALHASAERNSRYFWPRMFTDIRCYTLWCKPC